MPPSGRASAQSATAGRTSRPLRPLAYAADGTPDPYAGFEARIVPENITMLPKTGAQNDGRQRRNERSSR